MTALPMPRRITWEDRSEIRNRYRMALQGYAADSLLGRSETCLSAQVRAESDRIQQEETERERRSAWTWDAGESSYWCIRCRAWADFCTNPDHSPAPDMGDA